MNFNQSMKFHRALRLALLIGVLTLTSRMVPAMTDYLAPRPADGAAAPTHVTVDGIPFLHLADWFNPAEGSTAELKLPAVRAEALYVQGCLNSVDAPNPGYWGCGDSKIVFFIGDSAGSLAITYQSGQVDRIPLIFGYNVWWDAAYRDAPEPFASDPAARALLEGALCVAGGIDAHLHKGQPYYIKIALRAESVTALALTDNPDKVGHYVVQGLTFAGAHLENPPAATPPLERLTGADVPDTATLFLATHTIDAANPYPPERQQAVKAVARLLSTYPDDISDATLAATPPTVNETNFPGPKVRFSGSPVASLLTNIYYENANELLGRIDATGQVHESGEKADYYRGPGTWTGALGAFHTDAYTRLRALTLLTNMGFDEKVNLAIAFFDKWLMYFPQSFPTLQLGGKPVPGHATVVANKPHVYFDTLIHAGGWKTRYTTRDMGNPESDGHGMLMLTRWRAWLKQGATREWIDQRWAAINEAAEFIPWQLEHPDLSFSKNGLTYGETEGCQDQNSLYCDVNCQLALLAYAQMADAAGHPDKAARWRDTAGRLATAMEAFYPKPTPEWGVIWDPDKDSMWSPHHSTLAPVVSGMDYWGYDVARHLPARWLEITRNTYRRQLAQNRPEWCATMCGMGYGQGFITQAALLLDQMADADKMAQWMARFCFAPRLPHPYRVPEGANLASDGSVWRKWGDLGNLFQLAEVVYTIHVMLGIDDLDPAKLKLMPRLPLGWTGLEIKDWPVRTMTSGKTDLIPLGLKIERDAAGATFNLDLEPARPLDTCAVRLGPFPTGSRSLTVTVNGHPAPAPLEASGDSKWAWLTLAKDDTTTRCQIRARAE